jgi:hypothetical protein
VLSTPHQVSAIGIAGVLGWGAYCSYSFSKAAYRLAGINVSLAFCMGKNLEYLLNSPIQQPMAQIFIDSFGQNGTLALWAIVVLVQSVHSSTQFEL